jgi:hypothetical protein
MESHFPHTPMQIFHNLTPICKFAHPNAIFFTTFDTNLSNLISSENISTKSIEKAMAGQKGLNKSIFLTDHSLIEDGALLHYVGISAAGCTAACLHPPFYRGCSKSETHLRRLRTSRETKNNA